MLSLQSNANVVYSRIMQQLSPKKYIQTKARSLPIYKCLINKDWEESQIASINVLRKHVNGRVTAGMFLIDLLCLGVKDTFYFFNVDEAEVLERYEGFMHEFTEIDYNLAHNIVYAGHDFAREFNIEPHPEFEISKYILEEDNDEIPLIDIAVGDEDGDPNLLVDNANQFRDALAKLKKYAGEGNYTYTVINENGIDDINENDLLNEFENGAISDYALGDITHETVRDISFQNLLLKEEVEKRTFLEQNYIMLELQLRILRITQPDYVTLEDEFDDINYDLIDNAIDKPQSVNDEAYSLFEEKWHEIQAFVAKQGDVFDAAVAEKLDAYFNALLAEHSDNVQIVNNVLENINATEKPELYREVIGLLQQQSDKHPLALLAIIARKLFENEADVVTYKYVYEAKNITDLFPKTIAFTLSELNLLFLIKLLYHLRKKETNYVIYYYELLSEIGIESIILTNTLPTIINELKAVHALFEENE